MSSCENDIFRCLLDDIYDFDQKFEILLKCLQIISKFENFENFHKKCQSLAIRCIWISIKETNYINRFFDLNFPYFKL